MTLVSMSKIDLVKNENFKSIFSELKVNRCV